MAPGPSSKPAGAPKKAGDASPKAASPSAQGGDAEGDARKRLEEATQRTVHGARQLWGNVQGFLSEARSVVAENWVGDGEGDGVGIRDKVGAVIGEVRSRAAERLKP